MRRGLTLVEMVVAMSLASLIIGIAFELMRWAGQSDLRVSAGAQLTDAAVVAQCWLTQDLDQMDYVPGGTTVDISAVPSKAGNVEGASLSFTVASEQRITYRFEMDTGLLHRSATGQATRSVNLGLPSLVRFAKVDPAYAGGQPPRLGYYNNRLIYRITTGVSSAQGSQVLTLVGAHPFLVKASVDTFCFWNAER
jgi:prepilin-type N-terminal cleavage/methylation domain-containing protein